MFLPWPNLEDKSKEVLAKTQVNNGTNASIGTKGQAKQS
jgi:hypothetical protein